MLIFIVVVDNQTCDSLDMVALLTITFDDYVSMYSRSHNPLGSLGHIQIRRIASHSISWGQDAVVIHSL